MLGVDYIKFKVCSQRLQFMLESVETLRNSTDRDEQSGMLGVEYIKFKVCSQRLQFMLESVETLRNSTERDEC
jgi:hypothetical protein